MFWEEGMLRFRALVGRRALLLVPTAVLALGLYGTASAGPLNRVYAKSFGGERSTTQQAFPGGNGGTDAIVDSFQTQLPTLFITFYGTSDVHTSGAAGSATANNHLLMGAEISGPEGVQLCKPFDATTDAPSGWTTLLKLPRPNPAATTNCNDGGGGTSDCHDNAVVFSCCVKNVRPDTAGTTHTIEVKIANSDNTDRVFVEKGIAYVDSSAASTALCADAP